MSMTDLRLPVRYYQDCTPDGTPCREEHFIRREIEMAFPVDQTALVLVDMWDRHFIESWIERVREINAQFILPAIEQVRRIGIHVIHAPCPEVADRYPQAVSDPPTRAPELLGPPNWPPSEFRSRQGPYEAYAGPRNQPPSIGPRWSPLRECLAMSPDIESRPEDTVVATGEQLHHILADRGILFLIYAGYAANWCLMGRNYGIRAMSRYGYFILALRDCTAGVEFPDTLENGFVTEMTIRNIEQQHGCSVGNPELLTACREIL